MIDTSNWNLYWNTEEGQTVRGNLVYSAYVSPDGKQYCQKFQRDIAALLYIIGRVTTF